MLEDTIIITSPNYTPHAEKSLIKTRLLTFYPFSKPNFLKFVEVAYRIVDDLSHAIVQFNNRIIRVKTRTMFVVVVLDKDVEEAAVMRVVEVVLLVEEMLEVKGNIKRPAL